MTAAATRRLRCSPNALILVVGGLLALAAGYAAECDRQVRQQRWQDAIYRQEDAVRAMVASVRDRGIMRLAPEDEGSWVRVSGPLTFAAPVSDPDTGVSANSFALRREVQYFQGFRPGEREQYDLASAQRRMRTIDGGPQERNFGVALLEAGQEAARPRGGFWVDSMAASATTVLPSLPSRTLFRNPTTRIGGALVDPELIPERHCAAFVPVPVRGIPDMVARRFPTLRVEPVAEATVVLATGGGLHDGDLQLRYQSVACGVQEWSVIGQQRDGRLVPAAPAGRDPMIWAAEPANESIYHFVMRVLPVRAERSNPAYESTLDTVGLPVIGVLVITTVLSYFYIYGTRPVPDTPTERQRFVLYGFAVAAIIFFETGLSWVMAQSVTGLVFGAGFALTLAGLALAKLPLDWLMPRAIDRGGG